MLIKEIINTKSLNKIINKNNITNPIKNIFGRDEFCLDVYKAKCIKALNCETPHEVAIILDKNTHKYLGEFYGGAESCAVNLNKFSSPLILLHGHPPINKMTLPVSFQDFLLMNEHNIDKLVAYNIRGEQSFLQKTAQFQNLNQKEIEELNIDFICHLIKSAPKEEVEKINKLINYCKKHKNSRLVEQEIAESLSRLQFRSGKIIDNFWHDNAKKLNLEYFSNYSL